MAGFQVATEGISAEYQDRSGKVFVSGPVGYNSAEITKCVFVFEFEGAEVPVVEMCDKYLRLIQDCVDEYARRGTASS